MRVFFQGSIIKQIARAMWFKRVALEQAAEGDVHG